VIRRVARAGAVAAIVTAVLLLGAGPAAAHPLGNFTINVYGGIIVRADEVLVDYVVDMAEIPAFQERPLIDGDGDGAISGTESAAYATDACARMATGVTVAIDGRPVVMRSAASAVRFPPGTGGLSTLRLECRFEAGIRTLDGAATVAYEDANHAGRLGWREVSAAGDGVTLIGSSVPTSSRSARLTSYPADALPPTVTAAELVARPGGPRLAAIPEPGRDAAEASTIAGRDGGFLAALAGRAELSPWLVAAMVLVALGVGAVHALGPGHGKALIGAYLVGAGGSIRQAVAVGGAVSVMHTASVLGLALVVVRAEQVLPAERVYPWLGLGSGLVALGLGSWLLVSRLHGVTLGRRGERAPVGHGHPHPHRHPEAHPADPATPDRPISQRGLAALAVSGGILPSPSALVVLLATVSLGRSALGLALIVAFSVGLAGSLIGVGVIALRARAVVSRRFPHALARWAPVASAAAILGIGGALTVRGLIGL
jgi:ABC-type nickel/cobalt efflux system permease component RcnA